MPPRNVHLVGSVPLANAHDVFVAVSRALGSRLRRIPDGETGARSDWIAHLEPIFAEHEGRPHWGKWHSRKAADLARLYPRFEAFTRLRERVDPRGVFLNDALRALLGA